MQPDSLSGNEGALDWHLSSNKESFHGWEGWVTVQTPLAFARKHLESSAIYGWCLTRTLSHTLMLKLLCLSEPKKKAGRLGSYAKPEKRNLLSIFELRGYDRLLVRLFLKKYSWLISWVVRLLSTWVVYFIFRPGKPMTLQVRFSFNIDIPMTMDQLRSTKQKENEIFLLGRSIPRNGDPFCRSIPLWLALLGMLLTILGHSWWWTLRQL